MASEQQRLIPVVGGSVAATWMVPTSPRGVVVLAHGNGDELLAARSHAIARGLCAAGVATLAAGLLTAEEEQLDDETAALRFDVPFLAARLVAAVDWLQQGEGWLQQGEGRGLPLGLFGASNGATAALRAAALRSGVVRAVVSFGGRPDLAGAALARVQAPVLLIVSPRDDVVVGLNQRARAQLRTESELVVVASTTHLLSDPRTLEQVCGPARAWFERHLGERHLVDGGTDAPLGGA